MLLTRFQHVRQQSGSEVFYILQRVGSSARVVGGGADIFPRMKQGVNRPELLVSLKGISPG